MCAGHHRLPPCLQAFTSLEMPAALAAGHISAAASGLLPTCALGQAPSAAEEAIWDAVGRLQAIYDAPLNLEDPDTMVSLLCEFHKAPQQVMHACFLLRQHLFQPSKGACMLNHMGWAARCRVGVCPF